MPDPDASYFPKDTFNVTRSRHDRAVLTPDIVGELFPRVFFNLELAQRNLRLQSQLKRPLPPHPKPEQARNHCANDGPDKRRGEIIAIAT
jgi:hypothetical protein